ncbi:MAG: MarR family transcriptional regulator [Candidatus Omnitrophota bacterium]
MADRNDPSPVVRKHNLSRRFILFAAAVSHAASGEALSHKLGVKITDAQADALRFLALNDHVSIGEISMGLGHTISGATKAVNRLEKNGWVERYHQGDDQRAVFVRLTKEGKKLADGLLTETENRMNRILWKLRPETVKGLERVLEEFLKDFIDDEQVAAKLCSACGYEGGINCCETGVDCVVAHKIKSLDGSECG